MGMDAFTVVSILVLSAIGGLFLIAACLVVIVAGLVAVSMQEYDTNNSKIGGVGLSVVMLLCLIMIIVVICTYFGRIVPAVT